MIFVTKTGSNFLCDDVRALIRSLKVLKVDRRDSIDAAAVREPLIGLWPYSGVSYFKYDQIF